MKHHGTLYLLTIFLSYSSFNNWISISLRKYLNFQRYDFLIGILDVCRIPRIYLKAKINFITSLRLLFYSESMRESSPYIKCSMLESNFSWANFTCIAKNLSTQHWANSFCSSLHCLARHICDAVLKFWFHFKKGSSKKFLLASRRFVGRRKEPILGYVPKNYEKKEFR